MAGHNSALPALIHPRRVIGGREFDFDREVAVMAIINRTPDSFFDQGATFALDKAVAAALQAIMSRRLSRSDPSPVVLSVGDTQSWCLNAPSPTR